MILLVVKAEILTVERTEWVFYWGFQALATLGKNSEMRQGKEKVLSKCGSFPAMSEHALPQRKEITKEPKACLSVLVLGDFCCFETKSCVFQADFKLPVKVRPRPWPHTTQVAEAE